MGVPGLQVHREWAERASGLSRLERGGANQIMSWQATTNGGRPVVHASHPGNWRMGNGGRIDVAGKIAAAHVHPVVPVSPSVVLAVCGLARFYS